MAKNIKNVNISRKGRFSTCRFWNDDGKDDLVLQYSRLVTKRDADNRIMLTEDGTRVEREWRNISFNIKQRDLDDLRECIRETLDYLDDEKKETKQEVIE